MMGRTHATSGAVAMLAVLPLLRGAGMEVTPLSVPAAAVAAAGAAMLPDLDHPRSTAAQALGPLTRLLARMVAAAAGGHRQGTHSLLGVLVFTAVFAVVFLRMDSLPAGLALAALWSIAAASMRLKLTRATVSHTLICLAGGAVLGSTAALGAVSPPVLVVAVAVGAAAHVAGDLLTQQGCPLLWPARQRTSLLGLTTGGVVERFVVGPALGGVAALLIWWQVGGPSVLAVEATRVANRLPVIW